MASSVVSELILFIVSLLVAGTVAGGLYVVTQDLADSISYKGALIAQNLKLDFAIINDPEIIPTSNGAYVFYVKNIGYEKIHFDTENVVVFVDGNLIPPSNLTLAPSILYPHEVGELRVSTNLTSGYHRIVVVVETGEQREFIFKVG